MSISVARNDAAIIDPQFEIVVGIFHNAAHVFVAVVAQWQRHLIIIVVSAKNTFFKANYSSPHQNRIGII